jgi:hypothetical protein
LGKDTDKKPMTLRQAATMCAQEFTIGFEDRSEQVIWVRTLSAPELQEAEMARHAARAAIRKLYADGTDSRAEMIDTLEGYVPVQLAAIIVTEEMPSLADKARKELPQPMEPDWSKCKTDAEREKLEEEWSARQEEFGRKAMDRMMEIAKARELQLAESTPVEELRAKVLAVSIRASVDAQTETQTNEFGVVSRHGFVDHYRIFHGIYEADRTTKAFDSIESVSAMSNEMKKYLLLLIKSTDQVTVFDVKNWPSRFDQPTEPAANTQEPTKARSTRPSRASRSHKTSSPGGGKQ